MSKTKIDRSCKHFIIQLPELQYRNDGQNKHLALAPISENTPHDACKSAADTYTKFLPKYYLRVRIRLCGFLATGFFFCFCVNWLDIEKTRNKMITWKHSSSGDDNIKLKFIFVLCHKWINVYNSSLFRGIKMTILYTK